VDAVVASGGEKVVAGGAAAALGFRFQYRWCGPVSLLQTVAYMRVFGVGHLVLRLLLPGLVVLRRLTVKPPHHVYFVRSTASTVNVTLFTLFLPLIPFSSHVTSFSPYAFLYGPYSELPLYYYVYAPLTVTVPLSYIARSLSVRYQPGSPGSPV
jgi:hypothetical protein